MEWGRDRGHQVRCSSARRAGHLCSTRMGRPVHGVNRGRSNPQRRSSSDRPIFVGVVPRHTPSNYCRIHGRSAGPRSEMWGGWNRLSGRFRTFDDGTDVRDSTETILGPGRNHDGSPISWTGPWASGRVHQVGQVQSGESSTVRAGRRDGWVLWDRIAFRSCHVLLRSGPSRATNPWLDWDRWGRKPGWPRAMMTNAMATPSVETIAVITPPVGAMGPRSPRGAGPSQER